MAIRYLPYQDIDKKKWDSCIRESPNGLLYASSLYLDCMSDHWDALVLDDYRAVMPLTWKKKYGICYLYQPFFTASLGVFGNGIDAGMVNDFLQAIPSKFRYWDIYLNQGNFFTLEDFNLYQRINYVLPMDGTYEALYAGFRDNIKRNIKKAEKLHCRIEKDIPVKEVIQLAGLQSKIFAPPITKDHFDRFAHLYQQLHAREQAMTYAVYTAPGELVASCVLFFDDKRAYYILVGNHPNGKTIGASHALVNAFIKDLAGKKPLLDFEGSDIHSLAFFYSSFGAGIEKYAGLRRNQLPFWMKLFKK